MKRKRYKFKVGDRVKLRGIWKSHNIGIVSANSTAYFVIQGFYSVRTNSANCIVEEKDMTLVERGQLCRHCLPIVKEIL